MEQILALLKSVTMPDGTTADLSQNAILLDALKKGIAHGSQTERDKLYPEIDRLKAATKAAPQVPVTTPTQTQPTMEEILALLRPQQAQAAAPQNAPQQTPQPNGFNQEHIAEMMAQMFNERVPQILKAQLDPFTEQLTAIRNESLEAYRSRRLAELGNTIIPELVKGVSKEEIEASIEVSKSVMSRFSPTPPTPPQQEPPQQAAQQQAAQPQQPTYQRTPPPPVIIPNGAQNGVGVADVKNLSMSEYAAQREQMLRNLGSLV